MARLGAHGPCLLRAEKETHNDAPDALCTWERTTRSYHLDKTKIRRLSKRDVEFAPRFRYTHRRHCHGWKLGKWYPIPEDIDAAIAALRKGFESAGWTVTYPTDKERA